MMNSKDNSDKLNRENCLDETEIMSYVYHKCSEKEHQTIENHLRKCPWCFSVMADLVKECEGVQEEAPSQELIKDSLIEAIKEKIKNSFVLAFQIIDQGLEVIRHNGRLLQPATPRVKGGEIDFEYQPISILKEFNGYVIRVFVSGGRKDYITLSVEVKYKNDGKRLPDTQFILLNDKKNKVLEDCTENGFKDFGKVEPGEYFIKIIHNEKIIGTIALDLTVK